MATRKPKPATENEQPAPESGWTCRGCGSPATGAACETCGESRPV